MERGLAAALAAAIGRPVAPTPGPAVPGGSIDAAHRWETPTGPVFVKLAAAAAAPRHEAEAHGLGLLAASGTVRVPGVLGRGVAAGQSFLALEWLEFGATPDRADRALGRQLARLHRVTGTTFGLERDNYLGATEQANGPDSDWPRFLLTRRLAPQLERAARGNRDPKLIVRGERLLGCLGAFYRDYRPVPSLLHGDLWAGNRATLATQEPVVFDPACYFGDREAELAMTRLFPGFSPDFYAAYAAAWPLAPGADERVGLHQLYHVLNHLNLFGPPYDRAALALVDRLLASVGG
jgi:fructosamine-3-kinase